METNMATLSPYMNIPPGEFIKEEMELRAWSNEDLAQVLGVSPKTISELLNNKTRITIDTSKLLSRAFDQTPQYWLNLDNNYRLRLSTVKTEDSVEIKSCIYRHMPINEMIKKHWINNYKDVSDLQKNVDLFWRRKCDDFNFMDKLPNIAARKSEAFGSCDLYYLHTWAQMAKLSSERYSCSEYQRKTLQELAASITDFTVMKNGIAEFLNLLCGCGVKFFILSHLPKTYLDGASFMHNGSRVIVYTYRYDRVDNFWFTIAHEIGHILLHIKNESEIFIDDFKNKDTSVKEKDADDFASNILKTKEILSLAKDIQHYTSELRILSLSNKLRIHPSVIIGTLKHHNILAYNRLNKYNSKVSDLIPEKYFVDKK